MAKHQRKLIYLWKNGLGINHQHDRARFSPVIGRVVAVLQHYTSSKPSYESRQQTPYPEYATELLVLSRSLFSLPMDASIVTLKKILMTNVQR